MTQETVLKEGDTAPEIKLLDDEGKQFDLAGLRGKNIALYFYPKADTSGCTLESKAVQQLAQGPPLAEEPLQKRQADLVGDGWPWAVRGRTGRGPGGGRSPAVPRAF